MNPKIIQVATAVPAHKTTQSTMKDFAQEHFKGVISNQTRLRKIFDNVQVKTRYFSASVEQASRPATFPEKNELYVRTACALGKSAIERCLDPLPKSVIENIRHFIFVSSTGISTPTIDAILMNQLNIPKSVKRSPIWGLGCLGGTAGISRAHDLIRSEGEGYALVLTVELCSLTFQNRDLSKSNLIASALFGDGAAAVIVGYPDYPQNSLLPTVIGTTSVTWPNSLDIMGWNIVESGMEVIFSRDIPSLVKTWLRDTINDFLKKHQIDIQQIKHFITHPGGSKVLDAFKETFKLDDEKMEHATSTLRNYGNMSSSSVLFVMKSVLESGKVQPGDYGIVSALGPGFSSELMLIQWN